MQPYNKQQQCSTQCGWRVFAGNPTLTDKGCVWVILGFSDDVVSSKSSTSPLITDFCSPTRSPRSRHQSQRLNLQGFKFATSWNRQTTAAFISTSSGNITVYLYDSATSDKRIWLWAGPEVHPFKMTQLWLYTSLPPSPRTSQQLFEDLCDSWERTWCWR